MKATIWHNPHCGTSRSVLAILVEAGVDLTVVEYLKTPPTRATLARLHAAAGIAARDAVRKDAPRFATDDDALDAMVADPAILQRPLVETHRGVRLARPPELVKEIL